MSSVGQTVVDDEEARLEFLWAEVTLAERPAIRLRCPDCGSVVESFSWERWSRREARPGMVRECPGCHRNCAEPSFRGTGVLDDSTQE